ncbi:hypothetical protein Tco_0658278 [Tanacetum coccineum]
MNPVTLPIFSTSTCNNTHLLRTNRIRLPQDYRRKCNAAKRAYEAKREKELAMMQCRELEFLMLDPSTLPPAKRAIIEKKQAEIMSRYPNA